ncbi:methyltransferase [Thermosipho melanesiensis]|uniref:O-methyltransferase-like protein n=2 Tax=Thermosipho melanesiensis TaxID=46541 RepID=A6LJU9_THEM4|nr:Rossmann-like fold-containing protein [Thermosipho melanesiensis]ABR30200.1 O-methyltransferase-like protein [Thermosipho melanesiensis BI429]APT73398.1 methyltransferase [Thermosipho melanesiensis]OOC38212.1 methyltransferase [Thermosipho melanesiensis]OOC40041.1 methyltransferase [Thermosipho melanesiensis]OOC40061.1 methyltransferase [Thermosipho melanesiensis]
MIKLPPFDKNLGKDIKTIDIDGHKPTHASVLLLWYSKPTKDIKKACELGTGTGFVSFGLEKYYSLEVVGVEVIKELYTNAKKAIELNNSKKVSFFNIDVREIKKQFVAENFDMVVFNPPFHFSSSSNKKIREISRKASNELLESFVKAASYLLRNKGTFVTIISPYILSVYFTILSKNKLNPQQMCIAYGKKGKLVLLRGKKNGGIHLEIDLPVFLY